MANKIARGTTGQATFAGNVPHAAEYSFFDLYPYTWAKVLSVGSVMIYDPSWAPAYTSYDPAHAQGFTMNQDGQIFVPLTASLGNMIMGITRLPLHGSGGTTNLNNSVDYFEFEIVCLAERITIGEPVWNGGTNKWDYPVTISAEGGTPPYTPSRPSTTTVSLSPLTTYTLSTSTSDSGSCTDSNSTVIGPAPATPSLSGPCFNSGTPESSSEKNCGGGPMCIVTSGNNNVSGGSGNPQLHGNYAGGNDTNSQVRLKPF